MATACYLVGLLALTYVLIRNRNLAVRQIPTGPERVLLAAWMFLLAFVVLRIFPG